MFSGPLDNYVRFQSVLRLLQKAKTEQCYIFPRNEDQDAALEFIKTSINDSIVCIQNVLSKTRNKKPCTGKS